MIKGEFSYLLQSDELSGEQIAEVVAASEGLVAEQTTLAEDGLEGLDAFLAPKYQTIIENTEPWFAATIGVERRNEQAWAQIQNDLTFLKNSLLGRLSPESRQLLEDHPASQSIYGMQTYDLTRIEPSTENATALQRLSLQDLTDGGHRHPTQLANPNNIHGLVVQKEKLARAQNDYLGVFRGDALVAFIKTHEWLLGDQIDFGTRAVRKENRRLYNEGIRTFPDSPLGILGLVADKQAAHYQDRQRMIDDLLGYALFEARTGTAVPRRVVIPIHDHDEVAPALIRAEFEPMRLSGKSYGMHQQLFEHPAAA